MPKRNSDGRFRNHNKPTVVSANSLRAQRVEAEATRLKLRGFSYEAIADQITQGWPRTEDSRYATPGRHRVSTGLQNHRDGLSRRHTPGLPASSCSGSR
jgi:hypothetical protein